jgi:hypothetical protein
VKETEPNSISGAVATVATSRDPTSTSQRGGAQNQPRRRERTTANEAAQADGDVAFPRSRGYHEPPTRLVSIRGFLLPEVGIGSETTSGRARLHRAPETVKDLRGTACFPESFCCSPGFSDSP